MARFEKVRAPWRTAVLGALLCGAAWAVPAAAFAAASAADQPISMGPTPPAQSISVTIVFKVKNKYLLENRIAESVEPGFYYHRYLSVGQFAREFAPSSYQLAQVRRYLQGYGITVEHRFADNLALVVSGPSSAFEKAFAFRMNSYARPYGNGLVARFSRSFFHRPDRAPRIPPVLTRAGVLAIVGLSNQYQSKSMLRHRPAAVPGADLTINAPAGAIATDKPGQFTVGDVAKIYDINPLYNRGIEGAGRTIGIATYADFNISDAETYWNMVGLTTKPNRIKKIAIDGGSPYGAAAGTGETSLDVEQSGGLAPQANIVVYEAPNTDAGGIHMFYQIVSDNRVDSLSYSWGLPEIFYYPQLNGGVDDRDELLALNQAFMEAAVQGISMFTASGDSGAYDTNADLPAPDYSKTLSVDSPASSPYMTAAGGTTRPIDLTGHCPDGPSPTYEISVPDVRAWAYDYLSAFYRTCYGLNPVQAGLFAGGGGGGVSVFWRRPLYQLFAAGTTLSVPNQTLVDNTTTPPNTLLKLKGNFPGRTVPDISMNADPDSGYYLYSTPDGGLVPGYGGTSFVAPQLNGITALLSDVTGRRLGFMNPQLYRLLAKHSSALRDVNHGDNWYWPATQGYDESTGVGAPNVAAWARELKAQEGGFGFGLGFGLFNFGSYR